jgi:2-polyprenyl-6-methoxyphenol hydroxylase-like FAD-dependent oxidoreductase
MWPSTRSPNLAKRPQTPEVTQNNGGQASRGTVMGDIAVLVAGAGPVGLTAAVELRRRCVACRIIDQLLEPPQYAKAVGVQPRTLEIFEGMGVLRQVLDEAIEFAGQVVYVDGQEVSRLEWPPLSDIPFGFIGIPQYETERILRERLAGLGTQVERDVRLVGFEQDAEGVTATLEGPDGEEILRAAYLVGADGAHSVVRKTLGLSFEGGAFAEQYMLGDVEVDWSLPPGLAVRSTHELEDGTVDGLVAIPLKGDGRYRMSMLVPPHLSTAAGGGDGIDHGFGSGGTPSLEDIQAVIDRLAPEPATARNLRWSSVFRISHRIVDRYSVGRAFVAGDAAHVHPPTGAQGMNTGIQDAHNLAWKLALAVAGKASAQLLDSYDAERRPIGEEVVGRTVRSAREGIGADSNDPSFVVRREGQLLIDYDDSAIIAGAEDVTPLPGTRAPDVRGLTRSAVTWPFRLFTVLGRDRHTIVAYAGDDTFAVADLTAAVAAAVEGAHGEMDAYLLVAPGVDTGWTPVPVLRDGDGQFAALYHAADAQVFVLRPDGYLGYRGDAGDVDALTTYLKATFA